MQRGTLRTRLNSNVFCGVDMRRRPVNTVWAARLSPHRSGGEVFTAVVCLVSSEEPGGGSDAAAAFLLPVQQSARGADVWAPSCCAVQQTFISTTVGRLDEMKERLLVLLSHVFAG